MMEGVGMGRGSGSFPLPAAAARTTLGRQKKCPRLNGEKVLGSLDKAREVYYEEFTTARNVKLGKLSP
jgi:hypothetical protein